jgi:hypothetical protein
MEPQKLVLQINGGGIIYIYTRTPAQTETQSLTYGGSAHLIWHVGFGVFGGRTNDSTYFVNLC